MDLDDTSIPALFAWSAEQFANEVAVRDLGEGGRTLTYAVLKDEVDRCAGALVAAGATRGDRIALWAPNGWRWIVASLAAIQAGAILVPVNTRLRGTEAAYLLRFSGAAWLFVADRFLGSGFIGQLRNADAELANGLRIIDFDAPADADESFEHLLAGATPVTVAAGRARGAAVEPADVSLIMFTSGTTGRPKGAMIRGGATIRTFRVYMERSGVRRGDAFLNVNPFFHAFGFNGGILPCLMVGAVNVPMATWDIDRAMRIIQDERIAIFPGPPSIFEDMLRHPGLGDYDLGSLRASLTGASTIPPDLVPRMKTVLGFERVITAYGTTEISGLATMCLPDDPHERISSTCGAPIPGLEAKVVDEQGVDLGADAQGELLLRGFGVMAGYYRDETATRDAIDADGWLRTGDVAYMDALGYIKITDRKKDIFIVGGFNVYPAEVELLLLEHRDIALAAVVGLIDERLGEVGGAFIVPAAGSTLDEAAVRQWCNQRMANYKRPRHIWIVDALPHNASGKVIKFELRDRAQQWLLSSAQT